MRLKKLDKKGQAYGSQGGRLSQIQGRVQTYGYDILIFFSILFYLGASFWRGNFTTALMAQTGFLVLALLVLPRSEKRGDFVGWVALIFAIEIGLPQLVYRTQFLLQNKWVASYLVNPQVTLGWFYFAVIRADARTLITKIARVLMVLIWLGIVFSFIATAYTFNDVSTMVTPDQLAKAESLYTATAKWWGDVFVNFNKVMDQGTQYFINKMRMATGGDYYTGTVDENQYETLGVFLKDLKPADPEFYLGETVTVWATLQAKTLEDGLSINVNCYHGNKNSADGLFPASQKGQSFPPTIPMIYDQEQVDIDCRFPDSYRNGMTEGSNKITVQADFHFETMAYIKTYFMDQDRLRSMERQGIDPLDFYGIEDKTPTAKFTNGPVQIGMGTVTPPIAITDAVSVKPRLGITLDTNVGWKGKIKQLEELVIMVPKTMSLDLTECPEFFEIDQAKYLKSCASNYKRYRSKQLYDCVTTVGLDKEENVNEKGELTGATSDQVSKFNACLNDYCTQEIDNYRAYNLTINDKTRQYYSDIGYESDENKYKTFSCRVNLDQPQNILGNVPVSTQYFRARARYTYEIEESTNVELKKGKDFTTQYNIPTPPSNAKIAEQLSFIYNYFYKNEPQSIKKWCENPSSQLLGDSKRCSCLVMSIMARESNGNVKILNGDDGKSMFLMQITQTTAQDTWTKFALDHCSLDDIDCNIKSAIYYLKMGENIENSGDKPENLAAYYNCGPKALYTTSCNGATKLNWECPKEYNKQPLQCITKTGLTTKDSYVPYVMDRYNACMGMDFVSTAEQTPTTESSVSSSGTIPINIEEADNYGKSEERLTDTPYLVEIDKDTVTSYSPESAGEQQDQVNFRVKVFYTGKTDGKVHTDLSNYIDLVPGKYVYDNSYPLIKFKLSEDKKTIACTYISKANSVPVILTEGKKKYSGSTEVDDKSVIFDDWIKAYYDNDEINLYDSSEKFSPFCTVPWNTYADQLAGKCYQSKLFFIKTVDKETIKGQDGVPDRANVQVQIDINQENDCCKDCTTCNTLDNTQLSCASCLKCETVDVSGEDVCQLKKSLYEGPAPSTEPQSCCNDCSCSGLQCDQCTNCIFSDNQCINVNDLPVEYNGI